MLSCSSKEITDAGITCRRLPSRPREENGDPWSTSVVLLTVTNRGELVSCYVGVVIVVVVVVVVVEKWGENKWKRFDFV